MPSIQKARVPAQRERLPQWEVRMRKDLEAYLVLFASGKQRADQGLEELPQVDRVGLEEHQPLPAAAP